MLCFANARLTLLAVPKTGTTALHAALALHADIAFKGRPEFKHLNLRQYNARLVPLLGRFGGARYQTVAAIREPRGWLNSWYRYRRRDDAGRAASTAGLSFEAFVQAYLQPDRPAFANVGQQSVFLTPPPGVPGVDHLFRYEQLPLMVAFLERALNLRLDLPRVNVSPEGEDALSPDTERALCQHFRADYALWHAAERDASGTLLREAPAPVEERGGPKRGGAGKGARRGGDGG